MVLLMPLPAVQIEPEGGHGNNAQNENDGGCVHVSFLPRYRAAQITSNPKQVANVLPWYNPISMLPALIFSSQSAMRFFIQGI